MRWSMDTHKYISETTRRALQVIVKHEITSLSSAEEIDMAERELGSCGVYKSYENAKGRIRRALFTYFKAYGCLDDEEHLTEIGKLYVENKITIQEFSFYYVLNYRYENGDVSYFPTELVLKCLMKMYEQNSQEAYITAYDFSKLIECNSIDDVNSVFINELLEARKKENVEVNERNIGFDVWTKMYIQSGILKKKADKTLFSDNLPLIKWILSAYRKEHNAKMGELCTGVFKELPILNISNSYDDMNVYVNETKALQAYLFESVDSNIINKYIIQNINNSIENMIKAFGIEDDEGFYSAFCGLERLIGFILIHHSDARVQMIGKTLSQLIDNDEIGENDIPDEAKQVCTFDSEKYAEYVNLIVYGTPGCGKSYHVKNDLLKDYRQENIIRTTFYQDYTNTDFVGQILPTVSGDDVTYEFNPGPFTLALERAVRNPQEPVALVIEELNRGNAASIFGDIFQLLDRENGKSEYQITNVNVQKYLADKIENSLFEYIMIPSNMSIIATMNTSDQNVFTLDTAFKRRWDFKKLKNKFKEDHPYKDYYVPGMTDTTWETFVNSVNKFIVSSGSDLQSEDKQLGVFFVDKTLLLEDNTDSSDKKAEKFAYKVLEYLWDDVAKFDRDAWFNEKIKSLDELVEEFVVSGKGVFKDGIFKQQNS